MDPCSEIFKKVNLSFSPVVYMAVSLRRRILFTVSVCGLCHSTVSAELAHKKGFNATKCDKSAQWK